MMKNLALLFIWLLIFTTGKSQQLYYLSDIPANPNFGVAVQDTHLYVIKNFGVSSFNIAQPSSPIFITSAIPQNWPLSLYVDGNYLYCGGGMVGQLSVLDISQPTAMTIVHEDPSVTGTVYQFAKSSQHLYFTTNQDTLFTADVSNPAAPVIVSRISLNQTFTEGSVVAGNRLFLGSTGGLLVYDLTNPAQPAFQGSYPGSFRRLHYNPVHQQLYALAQNGDIAVYNATNLSTLTLDYIIPAAASYFTAVNNRLAILTNGGGVTLTEAGNTAAIVLGTFTTPSPGGQQNSIAMQDSIIAYTTVHSTYLLKYGIVNPQGLPENTSSQDGLLSFRVTDYSIRWNIPEETKKRVAQLLCFDSNGREIYRGSNTNRTLLPPGTFPLVYLLEMQNGQRLTGRFTLEK